MATDRQSERVRLFGHEALDERVHVQMVRALLVRGRKPRVTLSLQQVRALRDEWLKQWPEVAALFTKK